MKLRYIALIVAGLIAAHWLGTITERADESYDSLAAERVVATLPGIGQGWIDTLRLVAGPFTVDTITPIMAYEDGPGLLGVFDSWRTIISIRTDLKEYFNFQRVVSQCNLRSFSYQHPVTTATPAAVIAHEAGHRFQLSLWPHGLPGLPPDTLPTYAQDADERFADRFSRAMMALRGWDTPDTSETMLNHVVRMRLVRALAESR